MGRTYSNRSELAKINPCSYRGYDYDEETGYYYLQTRYYVPTIGRFINMDDSSVMQVGNMPLSCNLYAYCDNNAINEIDSNGCFSIKVYVVAATVQTVIDVVEGIIIEGKYAWKQLKYEFIINLATTYIGNYIGAKCIYINPHWIQPRKAKSFFQRPYGKRIIFQMGIGSAISLLIEHCTKWTSGKGVKINGK